VNYLAHVWLAGEDELTRVGAIMADYVKGRLHTVQPGTVSWGVRHHRKVDTFVDGNIGTRRFLQFLPPRQRRYGGIVLDMIYDHLLASQWEHFTGHPDLSAYADSVYRLLRRHEALLPARFAPISHRMMEYNWFVSYADPDVLKRAVHTVASRVSGGGNLVELSKELPKYVDLARPIFEQFWPEISEYAHHLCSDQCSDFFSDIV
jgi:acyl carrier protein phosphodiesterase